MSQTLSRTADERVNRSASIPFFAAHLVPLLGFVTGVTTRAMVLFVVLYAVRLFAITAGYHRYFSHRAYRTSRPVQFWLAFLGATSAQKGPLWWAAHHRAHHRHSDGEDDVHSPQKGFWWSHVGWILCDKHKGTDLEAVRDLAVFPELRFLDRHQALAPWTLGIAAFLVGGWSGLVVGFFASTVMLWHATFTINSLSHTFGTRRFATSDTSRNNPLLALLTFGEGWHNNHHHAPASARQGIYWWELDISWLGLRALRCLRLVRDLREPSAAAMASDRLADGAFDLGMFRAAWRRAGAAVSLSKATTTLTETPAAVRAKLAALEERVTASLDAAEDLTRTHKRAQRGTVSP